jgi:hypothetical protein
LIVWGKLPSNSQCNEPSRGHPPASTRQKPPWDAGMSPAWSLCKTETAARTRLGLAAVVDE